MNTLLADGTYDEALERLHGTGPEFEGWMSNHGPMAVEALARHGRSEQIHAWTDAYARRLEPAPQARWDIDAAQWDTSLGDASLLGEWIAFFLREVREREWEDVLALWWPRLLPGLAAGATHGVIRTGHAVRALRAEVTRARLDEVAHALGYWAARWQRVPDVSSVGTSRADELVTGVPRVPRQEGGIRDRLGQLGETAGWHEHVASLRMPPCDDVPAALDHLVEAVVLSYPRVAHGNPTMLVHAATAPNAVARALASLPTDLWQPSYAYAWTATAAVLAAYLPAQPSAGSGAPPCPVDVDEAWDLAVGHGGEHVIKLADTAWDVHERTDDPAAVAAIAAAVHLDA